MLTVSICLPCLCYVIISCSMLVFLNQISGTHESNLMWEKQLLHLTWTLMGFYFGFILCIWVHYSYLQTHQKRALDTITDGCEPPCGFWDLNSGPSGRAVSALNYWAISPALGFYFLTFFFFTCNTTEAEHFCIMSFITAGELAVRITPATTAYSTRHVLQ